jgi:hypothetical protein
MRLLADVLLALEKKQLFGLPLGALPLDRLELLLELPNVVFKLLVLGPNADQVLHLRLELKNFLVFRQKLLLYLDEALRLLPDLFPQVDLFLVLRFDAFFQLADFSFLELELRLEL